MRLVGFTTGAGELAWRGAAIQFAMCRGHMNLQAGDTALIWASCTGKVDVVRQLLDAGADLEARDNVRQVLRRKVAPPQTGP